MNIQLFKYKDYSSSDPIYLDFGIILGKLQIGCYFHYKLSGVTFTFVFNSCWDLCIEKGKISDVTKDLDENLIWWKEL